MLAALLWAVTSVDAIDALAPNVISEGIAFALALTIVDSITRKRDLEAVQPLIDYTLDTIDHGVRNVSSAIVFDYSQSHRSLKEIPKTAVAIVELWLSEQPFENRRRMAPDRGGVPYLLASILEFAQTTHREAVENRHDLLKGELGDVVIAAKNLAATAELLRAWIDSETALRTSQIGAMSETDAQVAIEESEGNIRKFAVQMTDRFVRTYEARRTRPAIVVSTYALASPDLGA